MAWHEHWFSSLGAMVQYTNIHKVLKLALPFNVAVVRYKMLENKLLYDFFME